MGKVVKKVGKAIGSVFKSVGNFVGMLFTGPKVPKATANTSTETRLQASLVPEENFKVIFGETAAGTDMRFWETFGAGNNGHVQVFAAACHEITGYGNLYLDEKPVSFTGNNATGTFAGLLSRRQILKGVSGASIALGSGARWTANSSMTGCAWYALIWTYNQEKMPQGIPSRITQVVKGAKVYDPRRDSTRGGSGAHRADNPATWEYLPTDSNGQPIGRNNALQMLAYTLGIKALSPVTGQWELRAGRGADPADIDFDTFIAAANACEIEGWYSDCILSTGDSHSTNEGILEAASGGRLSDTGGRFSYYVSTDDTANVAAFFTEGDIVGETDWEPAKAMSEQYNQLPGTFTDPTALFQTRPLPLCFSNEYYAIDGYKKRAEPEKLSSVQDPAQGQKLLRRKLNRSRYQGVFTATFNLRGLKVRDNSIVRLTFPQQGWVQKLFRVVQQGISKSGGIQLVLEEESPAIYLPGAVLAVLPPGAGFGGDTGDVVAVAGLVATPSGVISGPVARDAMIVEFNAAGQLVDRTEGRYKKTGDADWTPLPPLRHDQVGWKVEPLLSNTSYTFEVRHVTLWNVPSAWASVVRSTDAVTINPAGQMVYSNGQTVDSLRPGEAGANVTESRTSAAIYGQGWGATASELAASNARVPIGVNAVNNSEMFSSEGAAVPLGFDIGWQGDGGATTTGTVIQGRRRAHRVMAVNQTPPSGTVFDGFYSVSLDNKLANVRRYGLPVLPGQRIGASLMMMKARAQACWLRIEYWDANGNYIGEVKGSDVTATGDNNDVDVSQYGKSEYVGVVPANAAFAVLGNRLLCNGDFFPVFWSTMPVLAILAEGQISPPPYSPTIVDRQADLTLEHTAASIIGQGWGATASELLASNANIPLGGNNIIDSDFTKGWANFGFGWNGPVANTPFRSIESGVIKFVRGALSPFVTEATVYDLFSSNPRADLGISYIREYGMSIKLGDRIFASCLAAVAGGASVITLQVGLFNGTGDYIGEFTIASGGKGNYVSSAGDINEFDRIGGFAVIENANARYAIIWARVNKPATAGPTDAHSCAAQPFLTKVPAYQTAWPPYTSGPPSKRADPTADNIASGIVGQSGWATASEPVSRVSKLKNNGRSTSSYQVSNGVLTGATLYRTPVYVLGSAVNGGAARITIAASTLRGSGITVSYSAGTIDGCSFSTAYYVWIYDPDVVGGTVTYVATTDPNAYIDNADYLFVGNLTTIASGGTAPAPPPAPPAPPGYYDCVAVEAWLPTNQQAFEIKPGDRLLMLNERGDNMEVGECVANKIALAYCMIFETVSGIALTCSTTTPILFKTEDGYGVKPAWECDGSEIVPVLDAKQGFRWEALACQPGNIGLKQVAHISANDGVYAAGNTKHGFMFTHNIRMDDYVKQ